MTGPQVPFSDNLHQMKYRGPGEDFRESQNRVAAALSDNEDHYRVSRDIRLRMAFMDGGRVQSAMGSLKQVTAHNCFVSGTLEDSFVEGLGSIMARASQAAATMRMGGGIGYDFSPLRPRGAMIKKLQSRSTGPISFMDIFDAICRCIASSGHRRGAQMGVLRVDHPDIEEFIHAKQNATALTGFNISVAVTDEFMECIEGGLPFALRWGGEVYKEIDARALWDMIMRSTWDWAEPGVIFIDTINRMNNLWYCETIAATNPCGEQPLPPYGACLLGSFNLPQYLTRTGIQAYRFNFDQFAQDIGPIVRSLDNVIDRAIYPLFEQEKEAKAKRRMGLGVTGLANCVEAIGLAYGSAEFLEIEDQILTTLRDQAYMESAALADEKGAFPLFDSRYLEGQFVKTLPDSARALIERYGIRNSHLTSIAPTGTISLCADNVSSGIEPVFAYEAQRVWNSEDGTKHEDTVYDYGVERLGVRGKVAADVTVDEHMAVLAVAARNVDSAVSKTCNVPGSTSWEDFKNLYVTAWSTGCKGCATFRMDGERMGILKAIPESESSCYIDPENGRRECG